MTQVELDQLLAHYAEDIRFQAWNERQRPGVCFIYAGEYATFWKFTPREWWRFVTKTTNQSGSYDLPLSRALRRRPRQILKGEGGKLYSSDHTRRFVNLLDWTLEDWKDELVGREGTS
jgi:hypothetical protein